MKMDYKALLVTENNGAYDKKIVTLNTNDLPKNDLLVKVKYSSINYKDALSSSGNKGVTKHYPHVPGIDAVGTVIESASDKFAVGSDVLITGYDLGMNTWGGFGEYIALCGCVIAATGSGCGIVHLMGGKYEQVSYALKNMIANLTGMICDGAKPSCSMKLASGVSTALLSATLAMEQKVVTSIEGIIEDDVDQCILNLVRIGAQGMQEADRLILDIMTNKR